MRNTQHSLHSSRFIALLREHIQSAKTSITQLTLSPLATLMTFAVIGITFAFPMGLFVFLKNIEGVVPRLQSSAQISLYLKMDLHPSEVSNIIRALKNNKDIENLRYISPKEGLEEFQKELGIDKELHELKNNPLPGVIVVDVVKTLHHTEQIKPLLAQLHALPQVDQAQFDLEWLARLNSIIHLGQDITYALMIAFAFAVLLIIGNTIRLTMQDYHDEIRIIKLLGGTDRFVRRPFLYSGMIHGFSGSILAGLFVDTVIWWLQTPIHSLAQSYQITFQIHGLRLQPTLFLILGGTVLGYLAARYSVAQYIKKIDP